jgi:hypothetical protein
MSPVRVNTRMAYFSLKRVACLLLILAGLMTHTADALAQLVPKGAGAGEGQEAEKKDGKDKESPWLLVPTFSLNPKLGFSLGAMAGYLHYFDEKSQVSMFGVGAQYTSTESTILAAFGKASFDQDHQRLIVFLGGGIIKNDYDDFLGTGQPLKSTDDLRAFAMRYLYRVWDDPMEKRETTRSCSSSDMASKSPGRRRTFSSEDSGSHRLQRSIQPMHAV